MSQSPQIKGGAADEAFQEQRFLWERGASAGADFNLSTFTCARTFIKHRGEGEKNKKGVIELP